MHALCLVVRHCASLQRIATRGWLSFALTAAGRMMTRDAATHGDSGGLNQEVQMFAEIPERIGQ